MVKDIIKTCFHFNNLRTLFIVVVISYIITDSVIITTVIGVLNILFLLLIYTLIKFNNKG